MSARSQEVDLTVLARARVPSTLGRDPGLFFKHWVAELIGTFFLLSAILASPPTVTFAVAGATLLVMAVALGRLSGAHLNPAVTTALIVARKFPLKDGLAYMLAQFAGAFLAILGVGLLDRPVGQADPGGSAFVAELFGAFLLAFVVTMVTVHQAQETSSAIGVGVALAIGVLVSRSNTGGGGVINPAIALALLVTGNVNGALGALLPYLLAPLIGGVLAGLLGGYLAPARRG
jgi:glycerol uptake facilitator-like aquaporin